MISENRRSSWPRDVVDKCRNRLQANVSIHAPHETAPRWIYQAKTSRRGLNPRAHKGHAQPAHVSL